MNFDILKKAENIILVYKSSNYDNSELEIASRKFEVPILAFDKWFFPKNNIINIFDNKQYDTKIIKKIIECYYYNLNPKSLGYNNETIRKYHYLLSSKGIINENHKISEKGKLLEFILKNDLKNPLTIEISL